MRLLIALLLISTPAFADFFVDSSDKRVIIETGTGDKEGYIIGEGTLEQINQRIAAEEADLAYYQSKVDYKKSIIADLEQRYQDYRDVGAQTEAEYQAEHPPVAIPTSTPSGINWSDNEAIQ